MGNCSFKQDGGLEFSEQGASKSFGSVVSFVTITFWLCSDFEQEQFQLPLRDWPRWVWKGMCLICR